MGSGGFRSGMVSVHSYYFPVFPFREWIGEGTDENVGASGDLSIRLAPQ